MKRGRFSAIVFYYIENLLKLLLILMGVRAVLLILDLRIVEIPYIDDALFILWEIMKEVILFVSGSKYLPRL